MNEFVRIILLASGTLCVAIGVIGMFLPLVPTTPLLLLAAVCYGRSSDRFYQKLINNRWCGEYIRNYREGRGIALKQKVVTILILWLSIGFTAWFWREHLWLELILILIAAGVTIFLLKLPTYKPRETV
jgi:uncharacterized protein